MLLDPGEVLVDVGGVHHQEEVLGGELAIDEEVVHHAAVGIAHHPVQDLAGLEAADFVGEDPVDELLGLGAFDEDLAHMRDVEHADLLPDGVVLHGDGIVLDGHHEARKGAHLGLQRHVPVVQAGFLELGRIDVF